MKTVELNETTLDSCVDSAQAGRVVITRQGNPVAIVIGVEGLDDEQLQLGTSDGFWELIRQRRQEQTINRTVLEQRLSGAASGESAE